MATTIRGEGEVINRLRHELELMGGEKAKRAITEMLIQAGAYSATITPVDTSNLINSQYRKVTMTGDKVVGELGYGAFYALYVHRASMKLKGQPRADFGVTRAGVAFGGGSGQGRYWDPNGENKFLAKGIEEMLTNDADAIIKRVMGL